MTILVSIDGLVYVPPSLANAGRNREPKSCMIGNVERPMWGSQSGKAQIRNWDEFIEAFGGVKGQGRLAFRTKEIGLRTILGKLQAAGVEEPKAEQWTEIIASVFGPLKPENKKKPERMEHLKNETMFVLDPVELFALDEFIAKIAKEKRVPPNVKGNDQLQKLAPKIRPEILTTAPTAVDLILFGRMFANDKRYQIEAAVQVSHYIGICELDVAENAFVARDDHKDAQEDDDGDEESRKENRGAGHMGKSPLYSNIMYGHLNVNVTVLAERFKDPALAKQVLRKLAEGYLTIHPKGMVNSSAHGNPAYWGRASYGTKPGIHLGGAFVTPITSRSANTEAVERIEKRIEYLNQVFGPRYTKSAAYSLDEGKGTLEDLFKVLDDAVDAAFGAGSKEVA